jgi:hypothetical protein
MIQSAIVSSRAKSRDRNHPLAMAKHVVAAILFIAFAAYLYQPHFATFLQWRLLVPVSAVVGAFGAYALSRRWVAGFAGSCLAGAIYGFGPLTLSLARCHPSVGVVAACIPWLCVPAVFLGRQRRSILHLPLWLVPFAAIALYFWLCASQRLFVAPIEFAPRAGDILGFAAPLVMLIRSWVIISVYHVAIAPLILGFAIMVAARRYSFFFLLLAGSVLAFFRPFPPSGQAAWLGCCPALWLTLPMVSLAILAAVGLQGLLEAGSADKKWVLVAAAGQALLAILMLLLAAKYFQFIFHLADRYAQLLVEESKMYLLGMMAVTMVFLMTCRQLRLQWLRWLILATAPALDIVISAQDLVDRVL